MIFFKTKLWLAVTILVLVHAVAYFGVAVANTQQLEAQPSTSSTVQENEELKSRIENLEDHINVLESRIGSAESSFNNFQNGASIGAVSFLFGAFCALWAQNTRRNAVGWFIIGAVLTVFAVLIVLWNNYNDVNQPPSK